MFKSTFWIFIFAILFFVLSYMLSKQNHSFPNLGNNDYSGKVFIYRKSYPLIVKGGKILAIVKQGEKPVAIREKVEISINNKTHVFTGEEKKGRYLGNIRLKNQNVGTWYLVKKDLEADIRTEDLKTAELEEENKESKNDKLKNSKQVKLAKNYHLTRELKLRLRNELEETSSNNKIINKALNKKMF